MHKLEKEFDKQEKIRRRSGDLEEETKGASEGS